MRQFAALVGVEERLKMLCLLTLADVEAVSPETLTPWKEELLWRLYVDTYNHLTLGYGDELIDRDQAGCAPTARRAAGRSAGGRDRRGSSRACRGATCSCSTATPIYRHVRLSRDIRPDDVHVWLERKRLGLGADRRHARQAVPVLEHLRRAVVVRHGHPARPRDDQARTAWCSTSFQFTDGERFLELNPEARDAVRRTCSRTWSPGASTSPAGCAAASRARFTGAPRRRRAGRPLRQRLVARYTDGRDRAPTMRWACCTGSAASSREHGCDVDLVLICDRRATRRSTCSTSRRPAPS